MYSKEPSTPKTHWPRKVSNDNPNHRSFYTQSVTTFDFDDNFDSGSYSLVERNNSVLLKESFGKSLIGDSLLSGSKVMEKKKMADMDIIFAEKSKWKKASVCCVCERDVDKKGSRHHCRICANTVCGSCSERKINDQRVCDICFFKANTQQREKIREDALAEKLSMIQQKKDELFREQRRLDQKKAEHNNFKIENKKKENEEELKKEMQGKEKSDAEKALNTAKDLNRSLASNIKRHENLISDKESQLKSIQTKLSALKLEMTQKIQIYKKLQNEYQTNLSKRDTLQELNDNSSIVSSTYGSSIVGKNYSIYSSGKNGKYNISGQPVQI